MKEITSLSKSSKTKSVLASNEPALCDFTDPSNARRVGHIISDAIFSKVTGLTVSNNTYTDMWHDAMNFAGITNGVISKNVYRESGSQPGYTHKDFIQFWTNKTNGEAASKNVQITGNSQGARSGWASR